MIMTATVIRVDAGGLLVRDMANGQEVYVHTHMAGRFRVGDVVRIRFNGIMTASIPPQIAAQSITRVQQPPSGCRPGGCGPSSCGPSSCGPSGCGPSNCRPGGCGSNNCRPNNCR